MRAAVEMRRLTGKRLNPLSCHKRGRRGGVAGGGEGEKEEKRSAGGGRRRRVARRWYGLVA